jgi:hypothetical protein
MQAPPPPMPNLNPPEPAIIREADPAVSLERQAWRLERELSEAVYEANRHRDELRHEEAEREERIAELRAELGAVQERLAAEQRKQAEREREASRQAARKPSRDQPRRG